MSADETNGRTERYLPDETAVREALQGGGRADVARIVGAYPQSPLAWAELADIADSEGRVTDTYASATVAVDRAREVLRESGWQPGDAVLWSHEPNRAYLRALDAKRRSANVLGLAAEAGAAADELAAADPDAQMRIHSEFTPTQVINVEEVQAMLAERMAAQVAEAEAAIAAADAAGPTPYAEQPAYSEPVAPPAPVGAAYAAASDVPPMVAPEADQAVPAPVPASWAFDGAPAPSYTPGYGEAAAPAAEEESPHDTAEIPDDVDGSTPGPEASAAPADEGEPVSVDENDGGR
ncbi:hypothetical protein ARHIZOSPH14_17430 [Agromyces rhizosphaerae]|uniref:DUF3151 family protein n=1 Tax=Agromyces rhizosphaerae TaxID=88374 RepID=A0A9W6CWW9_9MICO|nr:DUF3151 family protein [Agromyces rhizosphaerae]GLI27501.1 hypothetical protein ARHIZOSPH14_17430 [Agromyces rhizosphaerae]